MQHMKQLSGVLILLGIIPAFIFAQSDNSEAVHGTFTDPRDNRTYKTVVIGNQTWMAENLAYLPSVSPPSMGSDSIPYYYVYDYHGTCDSTARLTHNYQTYGVLYNWPAAVISCPPGWHLPSNDEWNILVDYLINNGYNYDGTTSGNKVAKSLTTASGWFALSKKGAVGSDDYPSFQNKSGFSALPAGYRHQNNTFRSEGRFCAWWTKSDMRATMDWCRTLNYYSRELSGGGINKNAGFSVRCIKDD
jgi:uncharacterized protein (TIGR02145 family)